MAVTFAGTQPSTWGAKTEGGLTVVLSSTKTEKVDKKEIKGAGGDVTCVAYFNKRSENSIEGYGVVALDGGASASGIGYVEDCTTTYSNEDFPKTSIKGTTYFL